MKSGYLAGSFLLGFWSLVLCLGSGGPAWAMDINAMFNSYTSIENNGTSLVIGGVPYEGKFYWGKWELQEGDLSFQLKDVGEVNQDDFLNMGKVCEVANHSVMLSDSELSALAYLADYFDTSGCLEYMKYTKDDGTTYCCRGTNFLKVLGTVYSDRIVAMEGLQFPWFLASGQSFSGKATGHVFQDQEEKGTFEFYHTISVKKDGDRWIEVYTSVNSRDGYAKVTYREMGLDYSWVTSKILSGHAYDAE